MFQLSTESRQQLVYMIVNIIKTNLLSHLDLYYFSFDKDGEHGEQILEALCASNINLVSLVISNNRSWWTREECIQLLQAFLRQ